MISQNKVLAFFLLVILVSCAENKPDSLEQTKLDPATSAKMARRIESLVKHELAEGLSIKIWGVDSLVADPVSIDVDDDGTLYYIRTIRQKNSEFDIRGHREWEIESIKLKTVEEKRAFLRHELSPENSKRNEWLADLNGDGSHDWKDLTLQKERVYRVSDTSGDGVADVSDLLIEDFNDEITDAAGGILKNGNDLYVGVAPDLWKFSDEDADGSLEKKESLSHGYGIHVGFSGHGMSGIELGPDGRIYWQIGDIGFSAIGKNGEKWEHPNSGVIVRSEPDGSNFEVFAYGNRNTHEFAFDQYGNLISEDNDGDHPGERERIVYIVDGADLGWRTNWQFGKYRDPDNNIYKVWMDEKLFLPRFPDQAAYIIPPIANFVDGPTGMLYNPGTALGPEYENMFFVGEFVGNPARSGIHAFKLRPKGAGFELGETKKVIGGVLATGIDFGPDGAMYIADWIEGWGTKKHGRIWKLDSQTPNSEIRKTVEELLGAKFSELSSDSLAALLSSLDMRVRQKSQFELVSRAEGKETFLTILQNSTNQLARVHCIWGISQLARKDINNARVLIPFLKDRDPEIRAQAARWIGDVRFREAGDIMMALLKDDNNRVAFFAAEALGRMAYGPAVNELVKLLESNNDEDQYIRHAVSLALARIGDTETLTALHAHPSKSVRMGCVLALRRLYHPGISKFLYDVDEQIVTEASRAINDDLSILAALPELADILITTPFSNEPLIRRAINANLRVESDKSIKNLLHYAGDTRNPAVLRCESLEALASWAKPSVLDRVDGRYRGEISRDVQMPRKYAEDLLIKLLKDVSPEVRVASTRAIAKLQATKAQDALVELLKFDKTAEVRAQSLKALGSFQNFDLGDPIRIALNDKEKKVRVIALDMLPKTKLDPQLKVALLLKVIESKSIEERQVALLSLATTPVEYSYSAFEKILSRFEAKSLPTGVYLELAEAVSAAKSKPLIDRFDAIVAKSKSDTLNGSFTGVITGGNADAGEKIFYQHQTAQCIRCHSLGDMGGNAGPRLNGIANRITPEQRLEALVNPSARLAPGFGNISLKFKNGKTANGILISESGQTIIIKRGNLGDTTIQKSVIAFRTNSPSSMPPMGSMLTKKEIRDVMAFLETLSHEK